MTVEYLPRLDDPVDADGPGGSDHPMRKVTVDTAFRPESWTKARAEKVAELFNGLAPEWHTRAPDARRSVLHDALARGGSFSSGPALELGSGVGLVTDTIVSRLGRTIAADLAMEMLKLAPADAAPRLQADAHDLPFPTDSIATLVCVNMLLFPVEFDRVLAPEGAIVWVNSSGPRTPIHLTADEVNDALPGAWSVVASEASTGTWAVARRSKGAA